MRWGRTGARATLIGVLGFSLVGGAITLGLRVPGLGFLSPFANATSLDYSAPPAGEFAPLRASYLAGLLGDLPAELAVGSGERHGGSTRRDAVADDPASSNDHWTEARSVPSVPFQTSADTRRASRERAEPASCSRLGGTVWYRYDAKRSGGLVASTEGTRYATALGVFAGERLGQLTEIGCNTSASGSSRVPFAAVAGTRYYFQVSGVITGGDLVFSLIHRPVVSLVSHPRFGKSAGGFAHHPSVSGNGRFVGFNTDASDLDGRCPCGDQTYVKDLATGEIELISVGIDGRPAKGTGAFGEGEPSLSGDGRYVAFTSSSYNLVRGDTNGLPDVFLRDRLLGTTRRISVSSRGSQGNGRSFHPTISADGRYVAIWSEATGFDPAWPNGNGVYRIDTRTGRVEIVNLSSTGEYPDFGSGGIGAISGDGRHVAFHALATNMTPGGPGPVLTAMWAVDKYNDPVPFGGYTDFWVSHLYVRDMVTGTTKAACTSETGDPANDSCGSESISFDGRYVLLTTAATNLVPLSQLPAARAGFQQIYLKDMQTGAVELVSKSSSGEAGGDPGGQFTHYPGVRDTGVRDPRRNASDVTYASAVSADGRYVVFDSEATNLVEGDTNGVQDVFLHDRVTGRTTRLSVSTEGAQQSGRSYQPYVSADGRVVTFISDAGFLVPDDHNARPDVFIWTRE